MAYPAMLTLQVPPSKSITHRALILGAMAPGTQIHNPLLTGDGRSTLDALTTLGASSEWNPHTLTFTRAWTHPSSRVSLNCGNSGTTLRLLIGQVARTLNSVTLTGDSSLQARPNQELLQALTQLGVTVHAPLGRAPVQITGPLKAGRVQLSGEVSSQYASSLLLTLPFLDGDSVIHVSGPIASRPYLDLTTSVATAFGLRWTEETHGEGLTFRVPGGQVPHSTQLTVEGDWSSAAFPLVAAAAHRVPLCLTGLDPQSAQGDRHAVEALTAFGLQLHWEKSALMLTPQALRSPGHIHLEDTPDLFPALCALAAVTPGDTRITATKGLRYKESDRISGMADALRAVGVQVREESQGLTITGGPLSGGNVPTQGDHRVHMAVAAIAGTAASMVKIDHPESATVSYPEFHHHLDVIQRNAIDSPPHSKMR